MMEEYALQRPMNPMLPPQWHIPDGEARPMPNGRLYLYGSLDGDDEFYCSPEYRVFSTEDFRTWRMEGPSLRASDIPWRGKTGANLQLDRARRFEDLPLVLQKMMPEEARSLPIETLVEAIRMNAPQLRPENIMLYAPDAIEKNGRYYLYFCLSDDSEGVATAESPSGPFTHPVALPALGIDPSVFVDEDGSAYLFWGQFVSKGVRLNPDMVSYNPDAVQSGLVTEEAHHFHEGSSVRRIGDTYYYVFADISRGRPTCLGYATAKHPLGPYTYQGVIIDNVDCDPESWNNHGCIAQYNGQWYVFYHRSSRNSRYHRRACCEPIVIEESGRIIEVKMTSQGAGQPFAPGEVLPAYTACGVYGGAYVDGDSLTAHDGGRAVFRYLQGDPVRLELSGEGSADIALEIDGDTAAVVDFRDGRGYCRVDAPERAWELGLVFSQTNGLKLKDIALKRDAED